MDQDVKEMHARIDKYVDDGFRKVMIYFFGFCFLAALAINLAADQHSRLVSDRKKQDVEDCKAIADTDERIACLVFRASRW